MLNMIRMELFRMFKTKSLYVIWTIFAVLMIVTTALTAGEMDAYSLEDHRTCRQTMLLIFHRSCSDCLIRQNIVKITSIFGIEHLICPGKSALLNRSYMHLSDRYDSG